MVLNDEPDGAAPRRSRLDVELDEILARADRPPTAAEQARASVRDIAFSLQSRSKPSWAAKLAPLAPLGLALLLALIGSLVRTVSPLVATLFGIAAAVALVSLWIPRGSNGTSGPRWRGRDLSDPPGDRRWPR